MFWVLGLVSDFKVHGQFQVSGFMVSVEYLVLRGSVLEFRVEDLGFRV